MIEMLQRKFVLTAMTAVSVLLLVLLGAINLINGWSVNRQTDKTLAMLSEREGILPPQRALEEKEPKDLLSPPFNEDMAMSARYFIIRLDSKGSVVYTDLNHISSVTKEEAELLAQQAASNGNNSGTIARFRYQVTDARDQRGITLVFLDTSAQLYSILSVLIISVSIGAVCWLLMLLLVILLSKRAILPIARNIERQKQFVTNAGHEIKTPLAIILANTDALELHNGQSRWSQNIRSQTLRLNGLMQNLLMLARMDEGAAALPSSDFSASDLLKETAVPFYELAVQRRVSIEERIQPDIMLHASRELIGQLFSILLDNAAKYTDTGGTMILTLERAEKDVILQTENTCASPPEVEPERLFERFYRGDSARTQKNGGYGVGLSVARAIVQSQKGSIQAAYRSNGTIIFTVRL